MPLVFVNSREDALADDLRCHGTAVLQRDGADNGHDGTSQDNLHTARLEIVDLQQRNISDLMRADAVGA